MFIKLFNGLRYIFWPLSSLYWSITYLRNFCYDKGLFKTYQSSIYTIGIGNLTVGGTGKTPHIEYLSRLLRPHHTLAILSRGYGRKSRGYLQANNRSMAEDIGDEPLQLYQKFGKTIPVFVCEKRAEGLQKIEIKAHISEIVLLDDAFQHRAVTTHLSLLLTDYGRLFCQDQLLPVGLLREGKQGAKRADAIIVTKCPDELSKEDKIFISNKIKRFTKPQTPIFFSGFEYGSPLPYFENLPKLAINTTCWLVSGIAQPKTFEDAAVLLFSLAGHSALGDHHAFTKEEVLGWVNISTKYPILTTEKDWVKIKPILERLSLTNSLFYYWPIQVKFDTSAFNTFILSEVAKRFHV